MLERQVQFMRVTVQATTLPITFVIPSLVNGWIKLDLSCERFLVKYAVKQNFPFKAFRVTVGPNGSSLLSNSARIDLGLILCFPLLSSVE